MADNHVAAKRDLRQEITDQLIEALEKGTAPWQKPWRADAFELPFNPTSGRTYRGGNVIHLMMVATRNGFEDPRWLTYRQAHENGWQVRQGEKGSQVEFWQFPGNRHETNPETKDEPSRDSLIYRVYTVFNAKQIDGIPPHSPRVRQEWEAVQSAETILRNSGARLTHDQANRAFYNRQTDSVHLPPTSAFKTAPDYYGTALHELAHWTGHPSRLNRETLNESYRFGDPNYAREELRAELASVFLMAQRGIAHNPERHAAYLGSWIQSLRDDKHEIFRAARDAHRATDLLLALELHKSLEAALAEISRGETAKQPEVGHESEPERASSLVHASGMRSPAAEIEL
jgi:antirestriction protein ArdC